MPADDAVTIWLGQLRAGESAAARPLWEKYFHRLVGLARTRLRDAPRRAADEEDVALSAFEHAPSADAVDALLEERAERQYTRDLRCSPG